MNFLMLLIISIITSMTNVEKSYIRVTNGPTEPIHRPTTEFSYPETTTPKQESWTFESLDDWNGDDEFWN